MSGAFTNSPMARAASSFDSFKVCESSPENVARYLVRNWKDSFAELKIQQMHDMNKMKQFQANTEHWFDGNDHVLPLTFFKNIRNCQKKLSLILDSKIPLHQETIYIFERRKQEFGNFSAHCKFEGFHVYKKSAVRVLQHIVEVEQAETMNKYKKKEKFRQKLQRLKTTAYYIFKRNAGLSLGCWVIFETISSAISCTRSRFSGFFTRLQMIVNAHSRSEKIQSEK